MKRKKQQGIALVITVVVMAVIITMALGLLAQSLAEYRESALNRSLAVKALSLAEGATEIGQQNMLTAVQAGSAPSSGTVTVNSVAIPYTVAAAGNATTGSGSDGLDYTLQNYTVSATATVNGLRKRVDRIVQVRTESIFQFTVFFNNDLEISPGTDGLNLTGRIQTNGDMYLSSYNTTNPLTLASEYVHAAGHIYRRNQDDGTPSGGKVTIKMTGSTQYKEMYSKAGYSYPSTSGYDSSFMGYDKNHDGDFVHAGEAAPWASTATANWNGTVQDGSLGASEIDSPDVSMIQMYAPKTGGDYTYNASTNTYTQVAAGTGNYGKGSLYSQAALSVIDAKIYDNTGTDITSTFGKNNPLTTSTIWDDVQGKNITVTDIDLTKLKNSGKWPSNGLIYAARSDATTSQPNGVRLINGSTLSAALTVASQDPVYIKGDFNTSSKKPAAIMSDATYLLGNKFKDAKGSGYDPADTLSVNAAFITGSPPGYFGGFEGFFRFIEPLDKKALTVNGSFVNAWTSQIAVTPYVDDGDRFCGRDQYWDYDTDFDTPSKLPPFSPKIVVGSRVVWSSH